MVIPRFVGITFSLLYLNSNLLVEIFHTDVEFVQQKMNLTFRCSRLFVISKS